MKKAVIGIVALLLLLIGIKVALLASARPSDQTLIKQALDESLKASREGRPGGVMDLLSNQLTFNAQDAAGQRSQISEFIKKGHPDVTISNQTAKVTGDTAEIISPVTIDLSFLSQHQLINLPQVALFFQKETATQYLVFPTKKWRLVRVEVPNFSPDQISGAGIG